MTLLAMCAHDKNILSFSNALLHALRIWNFERKFDHGLSRLLHEELHWLDVPERVQFKLAATVHHHHHHGAKTAEVRCDDSP